MSQALYQIRGLVHRYGDLPALDIPRLDIAPGAAMGLAGPNGSGKSTLLRILAFLEAPSQGRVVFDGALRTAHDPAARQGVTLLLQEPYLLRRGVAANLLYGLKLRGQGTATTAALEEALHGVGLEPAQFARRRWYQLSGGEAKRVALAARLALKPRVLLLDEPTAGVDAHSAELISQAALAARQQWGTTLVVASHDLPWLGRTVEQVHSLAYGHLQGRPAPADIDQAAQPLSPQALHLVEPQVLGPGQCCLAGRVLSLSLAGQDGQGRLEIIAGQQTFQTSLPLEALRRLGLQPGQEVWLALPDDPA